MSSALAVAATDVAASRATAVAITHILGSAEAFMTAFISTLTVL
jgi:hypothetical protein